MCYAVSSDFAACCAASRRIEPPDSLLLLTFCLATDDIQPKSMVDIGTSVSH